LKSRWKFKHRSMSAHLQRPSNTEALGALSDGLEASQASGQALTLAALPVGARLILRCRKDWRDATVVRLSLEAITLSVSAPSGRTYRVRRSPDSPLSFDGSIPVLGEGSWRASLVNYDKRW
jgi:hypothetical protein